MLSPCSEYPDTASLLEIEVVRHTDSTAMIEGFRVHWSTDHTHGTFIVDFPHWLCDAQSDTCMPDEAPTT